MSDSLQVRAAVAEDADALAPLLAELGYPATPADVVARLARLAGEPQAVAFVACRGSQVRGLVTAHAHTALNRDEPAVQLTLLVVASAARGSGAGRALVAAVQDWAQTQGARRLAVNTASHRSGAHAFYEKLGFAQTGRRYARDPAGQD